MKLLRTIALSGALALGAFSAVTYTACSKDACKDVTCQNGGTCVDGNCSCPTGYEGKNCEILSRAKFIGSYIGSETCTQGTDNYTITLAENSDALKITMTNLYNDNYTAICTMTSPSSFSFSGTQSGATFAGTGTLVNNQLTVDYTISDGTTSNSCKFIGNK